MFATKSLVTLALDKKSYGKVNVAYLIFMILAATVYYQIAEGQFSSVLTIAVMMQCFSFILLGLHTMTRGSASHISARSLMFEATSFICRLSSTSWLNGYLPVDATGDWIFQACDVVSLLIVLWLLFYTLSEKRHTYEEKADTMPVLPFVLGCLVVASLVHADMNARPIFDTLWMTSLFLSVFSALPQLLLISRTGGVVRACTGHFIAVLAMSRMLSGTFMWHARYDIICEPWIEGINHALWAILSAHALHLVMLADFGYYYVKAIYQQGLNFEIALPAGLEIV
jgi:ER lumen protein retaining receptor